MLFLGDTWKTVWTRNEATRQDWLYAAANLNASKPFIIQIYASVPNGGYAAVDDVSFRECGTSE